MATLVLVDLDSVGLQDPKLSYIIPDPVVVLVANTTTAQSLHQWFRFTDLANQYAGGQAGHCEYAIVQTMPEAADMALCKLLQNAATPAGAGDFGKVILWTTDKGLICAIENKLPRWWKYKLTEREHGFIPKYQAPLHVRSYRKPASVSASPPSVLPWGHIVSRTDALATIAGNRSADGNMSSPSEIAKEIDQKPHLITQLGVTSHGMVAVERLNKRSSTLELSRAVETAEALEFQNFPQPQMFVPEAPIRSIVWPGALRYQKQNLTVGSRLDLGLAQKTYIAHKAYVSQVRSILDDYPLLFQDGIQGSSTDVQMEFHSSVIRASVKASKKGITTWWVESSNGRLHTTAKKNTSLKCGSPMGSRIKVFHGCPVGLDGIPSMTVRAVSRIRSVGHYGVDLVAPIKEETEVEICQDLFPDQVGLCRTRDDKLALLSDRFLKEKQKIKVIPFYLYAPGHQLASFPIVVLSDLPPGFVFGARH
jgi:hypothetical protein